MLEQLGPNSRLIRWAIIIIWKKYTTTGITVMEQLTFITLY